MTRKTAALAIAAGAVLLTTTMNAGGWAVITLDDLPARIEAGKRLPITFAVRQHGVSLLPDLKPSVEAVEGSSRVTADAIPSEKAGHYAAAITLPRAGEWLITIRSGFVDARLMLLPLTVVDAGVEPPPASATSLGQQLFVAKGCVTCHQNDLSSSNASLNLAPQLVAHKYQDDYLSRLLANPAAVITPRDEFLRMPNLDLKGPEIAALVAFINSPDRTQTRRVPQR